ncbi:MAG TPA: hypothetical protein VGB33_08440 [Acidimicrobiia bacterium]|jgi:hypothetical protein
MRRLLLAGVLLLVACDQPPPLQGIDLPPASLPDDLNAEQWAIAFSHEFEPGFWTAGPHVYKLLLDCPDAGDTLVDSELSFFAAGPDFPTVDSPIYLRLSGLSTTRLGQPDLSFMSTEQETTALLTVIGLSNDQVTAASECVGEVQFDDGQSARLRPSSPFRP